MNLTIERADLLRSLGHVQSVVERRNTIPILANVMLRADGGGLQLTATDMDLEIVEAVGAQIHRPGATTAPAHTLYDIVRKLPEGSQVDIDCAGDPPTLSMRAGRSSFRLGCLPVEDFPNMADGDLPYGFGFAAKDLMALVDRTRFAVSTEETRYYLNGIYLHAAVSAENGQPAIRAVATDGHRLARVEMPLPDGADGMPGIIVPRKTVGELRKLLEEAADPVRVSLSDSKIRFAFGTVVLTSKLIDGVFPEYERVIPSGNDKIMEVDGKSFAQAVDRVSTIATDKSRAVKLSLQGATLTLSATGAENGSATEALEVAYRSESLEIGFNARYLLDITQQIEGDVAQFAMADAASPTVIRDRADSSALFVLMPMRV